MAKSPTKAEILVEARKLWKEEELKDIEQEIEEEINTELNNGGNK